MIRYAVQWVDNDDIAEVVEVLKSPLITQGPKIEEFEEALAGFCGAKHAVATSNGSGALHVACLATGVGPGDEVITSPNTFVASACCAVYCGAIPVFADIDRRTYNILPEEIEKKITAKTKAVIPVHFAGQSCDMEAIQRIVKRAEKKFGRKIYIIEDAAHALGSLYKNSKVGSCVYSDMAIMSFHPVKHITTAEGGAILTHEDALATKMKRLRSHGITSNLEEFTNKEEAFEIAKKNSKPILRSWYYEQVFLGYHYRTTDLQCALGVSQLRKLPHFMKRRRAIVDFYNQSFENTKKIQKPFEGKECQTNFHLYVLLFDFEKIGLTRPEFMLALKEKGIQTQVHYIPVYTQPLFQKMFGTAWGDCSNAEWYYQRCLSIPLHPKMSEEEAVQVVSAIKAVVREK